jgi:hypothetical protein
MTDTRPTWELVIEAAEDLTRRGVTPFELQTLIRAVQDRDPSRSRQSIQPIIQGLTKNAGTGPPSRGGKPLERTGHGLYVLAPTDSTEEEQTSERVSPAIGKAPGPPTIDPWFWEGNVQAAIVSRLAAVGWQILAVADTASRAQGTDIVATRGGRRLHIEVKGYPGDTYAIGEQRGQPKPTQPTNQARHWFAGALMKAAMLRNDHPLDLVAIGLPSFPTYRTLAGRVSLTLIGGDIGLLWVDHSGGVEFAFDDSGAQ